MQNKGELIMVELVLRGTYDTGIRQLNHLVVKSTPGLLLLGDYSGGNVWEFDWHTKQFLKHYYPKVSWMRRWLNRGTRLRPDIQPLWGALRGLRGHLRGYRVIPLDVRGSDTPRLPRVQENVERPTHSVLAIVFVQGQPLVVDSDYKELKTWLLDLVSEQRWLVFEGYSYIAAACTVPLQSIALSDTTIILLKWPGGDKLGELPGHTDAVSGMAFSPDGRLLVSVGVDVGRIGSVRLWDVERLVELRSWQFRYAGGVTFHPNGEFVAVGCTPALIKLWDLTTDKIKTVDLKSPVGIRALCFSPDGRYLYAGDWQGKLMLFEVHEDE